MDEQGVNNCEPLVEPDVSATNNPITLQVTPLEGKESIQYAKILEIFMLMEELGIDLDHAGDEVKSAKSSYIELMKGIKKETCQLKLCNNETHELSHLCKNHLTQYINENKKSPVSLLQLVQDGRTDDNKNAHSRNLERAACIHHSDEGVTASNPRKKSKKQKSRFILDEAACSEDYEDDEDDEDDDDDEDDEDGGGEQIGIGDDDEDDDYHHTNGNEVDETIDDQDQAKTHLQSDLSLPGLSLPGSFAGSDGASASIGTFSRNSVNSQVDIENVFGEIAFSEVPDAHSEIGSDVEDIYNSLNGGDC